MLIPLLISIVGALFIVLHCFMSVSQFAWFLSGWFYENIYEVCVYFRTLRYKRYNMYGVCLIIQSEFKWLSDFT